MGISCPEADIPQNGVGRTVAPAASELGFRVCVRTDRSKNLMVPRIKGTEIAPAGSHAD
jgi:hypothetical protein